MSQYRSNYAGVRKMITAPYMQADMKVRAQRVKAIAVATAPVGDGPTRGRYKRSFSVKSGAHGGFRHDRAYGRVTNSAPEAWFVEWGNKYVPRHRTLGNALYAGAGDQ
jgi:hypothetical protein